MSAIRGMVLWERNSDGPLDYVAPNHHTLSIYQGGGSGTWSWSCEKRSWGFSDAICLLPQDYDARWKHQGYVKNLHLYFTQEDLTEMNGVSPSNPAPIIFGRHPLLKNLSEALVNQLDLSDPNDRLATDHIVMAIMSQISRAERSTATKLTPSTLRKIEGQLSAIESGPPSLKELAAEVGMSARHLSRLYKATTNTTLSERRRQLQIEQAKQELCGPGSLAAIALVCGFSSQSHFTKAFRSVTGLTPAVWRKAQS